MRKSPIPQSRHHVMIYDEDWKFLLSQHHPDDPKSFSPGRTVSLVVHRFVINMKQRLNDQIDQEPKRPVLPKEKELSQL